MRTMKITKKHICLILVLTALVFLALLAFDTRLLVRKYALPSAKIHTPLRLALITDLHGCDYGEGQARLLEAIEEAKPDFVLLGGDIFDDKMPFIKSEELIAELEGRCPMYYVTGNHEYWSGRVDEVYEILCRYGVTILEGQLLELNVKGQRIDLAGISDPDIVDYMASPVSSEQQLKEVAVTRNEEFFSVLLAHRPERFSSYTEAGFDLSLAGHAHGGQWRIPGLVNGVFAPNQGWFPERAGGEYHMGDSTLIVSRGLARESTRVPRIFNRPELVIVDLLPAEELGE